MTWLRLVPLVLLVAIPAAQAQVMPTSSVDVTLAGAPDTIAPGGNATVTVTVQLSIRNVVCPQDTATSVDLEVAATPSVAGVTATLASTSLEFIVPQGAQTNYQESADTTLEIAALPTAAGNASQDYTVTASFGGGNVCSSVGAVPAAEGMAEFTMAVGSAAPPPGTGNGGDDEGESGGSGGGGGKKGIPGPALPIVMLGLAALAAVARRR